MALIHVIGMGLDGAAGLPAPVQHVIETATLLVGSERHISYFPAHPAPQFVLGTFGAAIAHIRQHLQATKAPLVVVLTSGDPLFFGLGRLLLQEFAAEDLTFHPHLSSVQLAFSRVKVPWQEAQVVSVHGRSLQELIPVLQPGVSPLAILTDHYNTPAAIARLMAALDLPTLYRVWVCENLGGCDERITATTSSPEALAALAQQHFAALNVVILQPMDAAESLGEESLPLLGIPDRAFLSFPDRPGLMTKREIRSLVLAELALQPNQIVWDIGAGTGSVSIEIARLCPTSTVYAIEKTAIGFSLIQQNCQRFQVDSIHAIQGAAPEVLAPLPAPDRVFIGGSGGHLAAVLNLCSTRLQPGGQIVLALTTLENLTETLNWVASTSGQSPWEHRLLQVNLSRSVPIAALTRWAPLNPVTLVTLKRADRPNQSRRQTE